MIDLFLIKKILFFMALFCLNAFGMITQVNGQSNAQPPWINNVSPDDVIWGIGTAKLDDSRNSMNLAELNARCEIVSHIYTRGLYKYDDDDFNNMSVFFKLYINIIASFEIINDTKILRSWAASDGTTWCLVEMNKSDASKYINIIENIYDEYYNAVFEN